MGPLQYQKQLRLQEARRLMMTGSMDVTTAALEVGYESPSQFNREYKRLFGLSPLKDIRKIQNNPYNISELGVQCSDSPVIDQSIQARPYFSRLL
jgi:AraC-like DNA-binding protein